MLLKDGQGVATHYLFISMSVVSGEKMYRNSVIPVFILVVLVGMKWQSS